MIDLDAIRKRATEVCSDTGLFCDCDICIDIRALLGEAERLRKDSARLDWLEAQGTPGFGYTRMGCTTLSARL